MPKVLGNSLNVKSVIYHQTGVTVSQRMNTECWQVIIDKDFLQLLVAEAPTVIIADSRCEIGAELSALLLAALPYKDLRKKTAPTK